MQGTRRCITRALLVCLLLGVVCGPSVTQETNGNPAKKAANAELAPSEYNPAPVEIDERPIFLVYGAAGGLSPEERASNIQARLVDFARQRDAAVSSVHIENRGPWIEILAGDRPIMGVSEYDARIAGRTRNDLAYEYAEVIRRTVTSYRTESSPPVRFADQPGRFLHFLRIECFYC